jgi:hypothetical protein
MYINHYQINNTNDFRRENRISSQTRSLYAPLRRHLSGATSSNKARLVEAEAKNHCHVIVSFFL